MGSSPDRSEPTKAAADQTANGLVEQHLSFVTAIARKILRSLPDFVELDDLIGFGRIGLLEAARRFDPGRGVLFKTFAYYRIRGAIYDGIRKMAWFSSSPTPSVLYESGANEVLMETAEKSVGRPGRPTLEDQIEETREAIANIAAVRILCLDAEPFPELPDEGDDPLQLTEMEEVAALMRAAVALLDEKERSVIEDYYFNHLTLEEAGAKIGLSKSWTSRLHGRALRKLMKQCKKCGLGPPS